MLFVVLHNLMFNGRYYMASNLTSYSYSDVYKKERERFYAVCRRILSFPQQHEHERYFLLAVIRRTLSLEASFIHAVESHNGQVAMTLVRLHLDTLARFYAIYWAEETKGMTAESFSMAVARGNSIKDMKLRGGKDKATDRWLIKQIEGLGLWIPEVYRKTSGAIHFSDFHINQLMQQAKPKRQLEDGALEVTLTIGPGEKDATPELYNEISQAFLHISMMLNCALEDRCERKKL
ncbi:hypothetical protein [Aeromonas veronii]|uniref:hypothetical protein n=1 Tax=Aeromonas veronii TaxID=654 RepID=UPI003B9FB1E7